MTSSNTYCTYVTFYSGNKLPPFYIGSSNVSRVQSGYHGTVCSKKWKEIYKSELKTNPHLFKTEIIATFETREEATAYELELQIANNVVKSPWFFNESFATINGMFGRDVSGKLNPIYGKNRKGMNKGRIVSDETKDKQRKSRSGKTSFINKNGDFLLCFPDDIRVKSGEYYGINKGKASFRDSNGHIIHCEIKDPRVISGELISAALGYKYTNCSCIICRKEIPTNNITQHSNRHKFMTKIGDKVVEKFE